MRRILYIITAALALAGCNAKEILVTKPVDLGLRIEKVSGSKADFHVSAGNENATYIFFTLPEGHPLFDKPEREAAQEHIAYLKRLYQGQNPIGTAAAQEERLGSFTDFACYKGSRTLELRYLSTDTEYKLLLFQIHPKTHEILGDVRSERFHTKAVEMKELYFSFSFDGDVLTITPSDPDRDYVWGFERVARIEDDYDRDPFFYIYALIDMYEDYGFIEHRFCRGTVEHDMSRERLREGEPYHIIAIGYENGEINSSVNFAIFYLRGEGYVLERV